MKDIYCYSYVEDHPSAAVVRKMVDARNARSKTSILFRDGFPSVVGGFGAIKTKCEALMEMAKSDIPSIVLADLDRGTCACLLIRDWFSIPRGREVVLPPQCIFRVVVREIESWIIADHAAWAIYIGIPAANFSEDPDQLEDPKRHLLDVIRRKGRKRIHRDMLPARTAHVGPKYNDVLCDFVRKNWDPDRATEKSPSLARAMKALMAL